LRWIKTSDAKSDQIANMDRSNKTMSSHQQRSDTVGGAVAWGAAPASATVPAAWPAAVSQLAQYLDAWQRSEQGQGDPDRPARARL
jgi:hypothetical protein